MVVMADLRLDLPRWCYETPSNILEAMAREAQSGLTVPFLGIEGPVFWTDLIAAAKEREWTRNG